MYASVARFTSDVPRLPLLLLYRCSTARMLVKFIGTVDWNYPTLCSGMHAHIIRTHAHRSTVRSCHKTKTATVIPGTMEATTPHAYRLTQAHSSRQHSSNGKEQNNLNDTSVVETVFLVPP